MHDFSTENKEYGKYLNSKSRKYYLKEKCNELLRILEQYNSHPDRTLDLGCGDGMTEEFIHKYVNRIIGVDSARNILVQAQRHSTPKCQFIQGDVLNLPFNDNHFDFLFQFCLLHHLSYDNQKLLFTEINRVAKKNALLLTFEHNPSNLVTRYLVRKSTIDKGVSLLHLCQMEELHRQVNIKIIKKGYITFFPSFLSPLSLFGRLLNGIPYGGQYYILGKIT